MIFVGFSVLFFSPVFSNFGAFKKNNYSAPLSLVRYEIKANALIRERVGYMQVICFCIYPTRARMCAPKGGMSL